MEQQQQQSVATAAAEPRGLRLGRAVAAAAGALRRKPGRDRAQRRRAGLPPWADPCLAGDVARAHRQESGRVAAAGGADAVAVS